MKFSHHQQQVAIREIIIDSFNLDEVRTLSNDLGISYEDLGAVDTLTARSRELCAYAQKHNTVEKLLNHCVRLRPNVNWWEVWSQSGSRLALDPVSQSTKPITGLGDSIIIKLLLVTFATVLAVSVAIYIGGQNLLGSLLANQPTSQSSSPKIENTVATSSPDIRTVVVTVTTVPTSSELSDFFPVESGTVKIYDSSKFEESISLGKKVDLLKDSWSTLTTVATSGIFTYNLAYSITEEVSSSVSLIFNFDPKLRDVSGYRTLNLSIDSSNGLIGKTICLVDISVQKCSSLGDLGVIKDGGQVVDDDIKVSRNKTIYEIQMNLVSGNKTPLNLAQLRFVVFTLNGNAKQSGNRDVSFGKIGFSK